MRDTPPEFERLVTAQYLRLTAGERVRLCTEMFDAARVLIESGLPRDLSDRERRRRVTERLYGAAFAKRVFPAEPDATTRAENPLR